LKSSTVLVLFVTGVWVVRAQANLTPSQRETAALIGAEEAKKNAIAAGWKIGRDADGVARFFDHHARLPGKRGSIRAEVSTGGGLRIRIAGGGRADVDKDSQFPGGRCRPQIHELVGCRDGVSRVDLGGGKPYRIQAGEEPTPGSKRCCRKQQQEDGRAKP
jgi:hypothetical protein